MNYPIQREPREIFSLLQLSIYIQYLLGKGDLGLTYSYLSLGKGVPFYVKFILNGPVVL